MFKIYEKEFGYESEKTAKIFTEIGKTYELADNIQEAADNYKNSFSILEKIIKDGNFEVLFTLALKISELLEKIGNKAEAYNFLKKVYLILLS
jgi:tetratricopeptide (TPR) repeat protein